MKTEVKNKSDLGFDSAFMDSGKFQELKRDVENVINRILNSEIDIHTSFQEVVKFKSKWLCERSDER